MIRTLALLLLPAMAHADALLVFAPASLGGPLDAVTEAFEQASGHQVTISYAGTAALAFQIRQGAPADVFISASTEWMDALEAGGVVTASRRDILGNALVLVSHRPEEFDIAALPAMAAGERIAMALTEAVPAGQYGRAALEHFGLWSQVAAQVVETDNVRAALRLVALGEARYGVVYRTDALAEPGVTVAYDFPETSHPPIRYPAAALNDAPAAMALLDFLTAPQAQAIFAQAGFLPPGGAGP